LNEEPEARPTVRECRKESLQKITLRERNAHATAWERLKRGTSILLSGDYGIYCSGSFKEIRSGMPFLREKGAPGIAFQWQEAN
jgi:hypothetical protein